MYLYLGKIYLKGYTEKTLMGSAKKIAWGIAGLVGIAALGYGVWYSGAFQRPLAPGTPYPSFEALPQEEPRRTSPDMAGDLMVETVVTGLEVPWSLVFTASNRLLVTARPGKIFQVVDEKLVPEPLAVFPEVVSEGEEGLMGLALDPDYLENHWVYASLAYSRNEKKILKVMRFRDEGDRISAITTILDDIPAATYHAGSRLKFGPDNLLYVTTGDATDKNLAQDKNSLAGKILRVQSDGSVPADNPFPGSAVWSYGHRNPQGIAWHPISGELYATEHGPSLFDGPAGGDEVNRIVKGGNYGWPLVSHEKKREGTVAPLLVFTPAEAPASAVFYRSDKIPQFTNQFFFGALKGEGLMRVKFADTGPDTVVEYEKLPEVKAGRIRDVIEGPDCALYFTTSNRDVRGKPQSGDDKIYRLRAKE